MRSRKGYSIVLLKKMRRSRGIVINKFFAGNVRYKSNLQWSVGIVPNEMYICMDLILSDIKFYYPISLAVSCDIQEGNGEVDCKPYTTRGR